MCLAQGGRRAQFEEIDTSDEVTFTARRVILQRSFGQPSGFTDSRLANYSASRGREDLLALNDSKLMPRKDNDNNVKYRE
jgi:hypothetical protein